MKVVIFSKFSNYLAGGAEKSLTKIINDYESIGDKVQIVSFYLKTDLHKNPLIKDSEIHSSYYVATYNFRRFFMWEYVLNRSSLSKFVTKNFNANEVVSYGFYSPIAINAAKCKTKVYIRSAIDLGIRVNVYAGFKKIIKYIYLGLEYPAYIVYLYDLRRSLHSSEIISNSKYISAILKKKYNIDSKVVYPHVDENELLEAFNQSDNISESEKGIVFVGDDENKGLSIVLALSEMMPETKFYIFSRVAIDTSKYSNVISMNWVVNVVDIYKYASLVLVPSQFVEAYGRVARESHVLNIPTLVSKLGGLPEAVDYDEAKIVVSYDNINDWYKQAMELL